MSSKSKKSRKNQPAEQVEENTSPWNWKWALLAFIIPATAVLILNGLTSISYLTWHQFNDYFYDADPAIKAFTQGNLSFWHVHGATPAMMPLSVLLRGILLAPIVHIASLGWNGRYVIGAALLVGLSAAAISYSLDQILDLRDRSSRGKLVIGVALLTVVFPLFAMSLIYGHPEEIFGASLLLTSVVLLSKGQDAAAAGQESKLQWLWPSLLVGLTMSVKQDFWVAAPALLLICPARWRWRMVGTAVLTTLFFSIPQLVTGSTPFSSGVLTLNSGLATSKSTVWLVFGSNLHFAINHSRYFLAAGAIIIPLIAYFRNSRVSLSQALLCVGAVMLLRAFLDVDVADYYYLSAFLCFLGAETCYIKKHHDLEAYKIQPYKIPLPWATLLWGVVVWQLTTINSNYNWLIRLMATNQKYIIPGLCVIACLVPLAICIRVLYWPEVARPIWKLRGYLVTSTVVLTTLICSLTAFGSSAPARLISPDGFYANIKTTTAIAAHEPVYWLGRGSTEISIPLPGNNNNVATWVAYAFKTSLNGEPPVKPGAASQLGVATERSITPSLPEIIKTCGEQPLQCPSGTSFVETPIGPSVLVVGANPTGWALYVEAPNHEEVWVDAINIPSASSNVSNIAKTLSRATPKQISEYRTAEG